MRGDTIFINSKQLHYPLDINNAYCTYIVTVIHPRLLMSSPEVESEYVLPIVTDSSLPYILWRTEDPVASKVSAIIKEINVSRGNPFEITRSFFELWHYVLACASVNITEFSPLHYQHIESLKDKIVFIKESYANRISLAKIATSGNVSKSTCNNIFKKHTGYTPNEYLIRYRLGKATELLSNSDKSIGIISEMCGFASASYMTEQFVKTYNITPRNFRKEQFFFCI